MSFVKGLCALIFCAVALSLGAIVFNITRANQEVTMWHKDVIYSYVLQYEELRDVARDMLKDGKITRAEFDQFSKVASRLDMERRTAEIDAKILKVLENE